MDKLNELISELLHIDEGTSNKLIDLEAKDIAKTYYLSNSSQDNIYEYTIDIIKKRLGKPGNTILKNSSLSTSGEQRIGNNLNMFEWVGADNEKDPSQLHKFIETIYSELQLKGNNPLFLSVGALKWKVEVKKDTLKEVISPLLIFPIRLIRGAKISPVAIEFVDDDAYFNPCLFHRIKRDLLDEIAESFPLPNGSGFSFDDPIDVERLDINEYFSRVKEYVIRCFGSEENVTFEFLPNVIAISHFNHNEICMYYDLKRNKNKIANHSLVKRMFNVESGNDKISQSIVPSLILQADSVQEKMINDVLSGKSMVIKGPPGTGKTLTIANMIVSLMESGKSVLVSSKKLAALSEVYAKVPSKLRKFLLLLDSESEAEASKINPSEIKMELREILDRKKTYSLSENVIKDKDFAEKVRGGVVSDMLVHVKQTFKDKKFFGSNYYEAADIFCKDENIPIYKFSTDDVLNLTRDSFNTLMTIIEDMENYFVSLSNDGKHTVYKCPWYGISEEHNIQKIGEKYQDIASDMQEIISIFEKEECKSLNENIDLITLSDIKAFVEGDLSKYQMEVLLDNDYSSEVLIKNLNDYSKDKNIEKYCKYFDKIIDPEKGFISLNATTLDRNLKKSEMEIIKENLSLFDNPNSNFLNNVDLENLNAIYNKKLELEKEINEREYASWKVFKKDLTNEDITYIIKANSDLSSYLNGNYNKPKALDFKSKSLIKKLNELTYLDSVSFIEMVNAVNEIFLIDLAKSKIKENEKLIQRIFQRQLNDSLMSCVYLLLKNSQASNVDIKTYVNAFKNNYQKVEEFADVLNMDNDYSLQDVINVYSLASKYQTLKYNLESLNREDIKFSVKDPMKIVSFANQIVSINNLKTASNNSIKIDSLYTLIEVLKKTNHMNSIIEKIDDLIGKLDAFGKEEYINYYSQYPNDLSIKDFKIFIEEAKNTQLIGSSIKYGELLTTTKDVLNIYDFFKSLERGEFDRKGYSIKEVFEHSIYYAALIKYKEYMGSRSYDVGSNMEINFQRFLEQEEIIRDKNVELIESKLLSSIKMDEREFAFLDLERDNGKLRTLFKKHAKEILKLKRCLIMSPATASILFSTEDYENFDVVIVDEASQVEPVTILPVLYRSKQCVIVGDEWQMPPIHHFKTKNSKIIEDYDMTLEPDASALSVILNSGNFSSTTLECHYRSQTESLIRFSQKEFYPNMKTFPSPIPKRDGLGFVDILAENAKCIDGINDVEANIVIEQLNRLFDKYFIDEKLSESIGVITFGEKQKERILSIINKNKEISNKINLAIQNKTPGIVDEKVIFFKTIEEVQGCEASHIIISFTYGVDKNGKQHNRFGELNRDKLGKCIFNVAVTRAQKSITVIHSIPARDIDAKENSKIAYIKDYLEISEKFALEGKGQFVSSPVHKGFYYQVGQYLIEQGIEEDRIIFNYGVTEGSVKIPLVVLNKDKQEALFALFLEKDITSKYNYLDYNIKYYDILKNNYKWNIQRVFINDWVFNQDMVKNKIKLMIEQKGR